LTKKIFPLLVLLSAIAYGLVWLMPDVELEDTSPIVIPSSQTLQSPMPATPGDFCKVVTGLETGRVNLRECAGTACPVLRVLEDGQMLTVVKAGAWNEVTTADGVRGWINSTFCK